MTTTFLEKQADATRSLGNYRLILVNLSSSPLPDTNPALILAGEMIQSSGGYDSQAMAIGAGSYNASSQKWEFPMLTGTFEEAPSGAGYQFTDAILWQGRGAISNKPIASIDTSADTISCNSHGLVSGDLAFVASTGTLPGGLSIQRYFAEVLDVNTVKLHTTEALNTPIDMTDSGVGTLRLIHANGCFVKAQSFGTTTINPGSSQSIALNWKIRNA